jgi:hypothetical protein
MTVAAARKLNPLSAEFYAASAPLRFGYQVSAKSRWGDDIWYFEPRRSGLVRSRCCYRWTGLLNPPELIDDIKLFVFSVHHENFRGRAAKTSGAATRSYIVRRFLQWMHQVGVERLSDLPPGFGFQYLSFLLGQPGAGKLRDSSIGRLLDVPVHIYEQAQVMRSAGRDTIACHPFNGRNPYVLGKDHGQESGTIPPVPDALFVKVAAEVFRWLERNSLDLIQMLAQSVAARNSGRYDYEKWRAYGVNKALAGARFDATGVEWRQPLGQYASSELGDLLKDLRAACLIAVQAFTGIRINELLSLEAEPRSAANGWPACLCLKSSRNGLMEIFYIKGKLAKGQDDVQDVEWVAGARPAGSTHLPPSVKAILVLDELLSPWRVKGVTKLVLSHSWGGIGLPDSRPMRPCSYGVAAYDQVRFIARHVYEHDPALARNVEWWRVSTHQWRKSFAQFVVRSDERLLRAVSEHFKHVSLAMTSEGYVGNDLELLGLLDDEALHRVAEVTMRAISGDLAVAGPLAELIDRQRDRILREVGDGTIDEQIAALIRVLRDDNVRSWSCGWGDCFFRPETARCHAEVKGTYSLTARRPNTETRRPGLCCDCANLIVLPEHRSFWESRLRKNEDVVKTEGDLQSPSARVAQVRVEQAQKILRRFDRAQERINAKQAV